MWGAGDADRLWLVSRAALATPLLAILLLLAIAAGLEVSARRDAVSRALAPPSYDTPSRMFDLQMERVQMLDRESGVDCVFLGSSTVQDGFDPAVFSRAYARASKSEPPTCFNLAVPGMRGASTGMLARVVLDEIDPWLIVYGFSPRDFSRSARGPSLHHSAWLRHRAGQHSARGWLIDRSRAYRLFLGNRTADQRERGRDIATSSTLRQDGFLLRRGTLRDAAAEVAKSRATGAGEEHESPDVEALTELRSMMADERGRRRLVVVEMPIHPLLLEWLAGVESHRTAIAGIERLTAEFAVPFLRLPPSKVPPRGWADTAHTNVSGAAAITRWLAERVAAAVAKGELARSGGN